MPDIDIFATFCALAASLLGGMAIYSGMTDAPTWLVAASGGLSIFFATNA